MTNTPATVSTDSSRAQSILEQLAELDRLDAQCRAILATPHYITGPDGLPVEYNGAPLLDSRPTLAAIGALSEVIGRRCELLGLYAPVRHVYEVEL
jgi:hypothetical protein